MKKILSVIIAVSLAFSMYACSERVATPTKPPSSFEQQSKANEENVKELINQNALPKLDKSQDFDNIKRRLEYLNQGNNVGYLYIFSSAGILLREVQVMGKSTSLNAYITPMEEIKQVANGIRDAYGAYPASFVTVQAPDLDGTYGENADGIFWFTPDGTYQELIGSGYTCYFSAERLSFTTQPLLIEVEN